MRSMVSPPLFMAMEKHNRELKKARAFIRGKQQKNEFELCVIASFEPFTSSRSGGGGDEKLYPGDEKGWTERYSICHGELNQHHILMGRDMCRHRVRTDASGAPGGGSLLFHAEGHGEAQLGLRAGKWDAGAYERVLPMSGWSGSACISCSCIRRNTGSRSTSIIMPIKHGSRPGIRKRSKA